MKIGFVGAGKTGCTLGKYFTDHEIDVAGYFSKSRNSARMAAEFTGTRCIKSKKDAVESSDIIFITASYGAIG